MESHFVILNIDVYRHWNRNSQNREKKSKITIVLNKQIGITIDEFPKVFDLNTFIER